jgi:phospholipid-binding lipoprotein MlaA
MRSNTMQSALKTVLVALSLMLAGCATTSQPGAEDEQYSAHDPLEPVNRGIFAFNLVADDYVIRPVAQAYRDYVPEPIRTGIHNFLTNLRSPVIMFNDALQGEGKLAGDTFGRFWLNTFLGLGGIMDVGTKAGIPFHDADFGQTFGVWGAPAGPYLVLPILGPSDVRDGIGLVADSYADPWNGWMRSKGDDYGYYVIAGRAVVSGIDLRARNIDFLDRIRSTSLDYYATLRSLYQQHREALIKHEQPPEGNPSLTQ